MRDYKIDVVSVVACQYQLVPNEAQNNWYTHKCTESHEAVNLPNEPMTSGGAKIPSHRMYEWMKTLKIDSNSRAQQRLILYVTIACGEATFRNCLVGGDLASASAQAAPLLFTFRSYNRKSHSTGICAWFIHGHVMLFIKPCGLWIVRMENALRSETNYDFHRKWHWRRWGSSSLSWPSRIELLSFFHSTPNIAMGSFYSNHNGWVRKVYSWMLLALPEMQKVNQFLFGRYILRQISTFNTRQK